MAEEKVKNRAATFSKMIYAALSKLQVQEPTKTRRQTYQEFTKEDYRRYITNPQTNGEKIREMSQFLYRVSTPYKRLIRYYASIPCFYWNLSPILSMRDTVDEKKILTMYEKSLNTVNKMNYAKEMRKVLTNVIRDGVFYGFIYENNSSFFISKLEPNYCKILEIENGCYNFAFDFTYFRDKQELLDYMDPIFKQGYEYYQEDATNNRWQLLDSRKTICIKDGDESLDDPIPLFIGIFESLLDSLDARTLQRYKDEIENYKLILQKLPTFSGTTDVDDFSIEIDTALDFYHKLLDVVPESVGVAMTPLDVDTIDFKPDDNSNDLLTSSMKNVFNDSGTSQALFNDENKTEEAMRASILTDIGLVKPIIESIELWTRRYLEYNNTSSIKMNFEILDVNIFNKKEVVADELSLANSGVPNKLRLAASAGVNPLEVISNQIFENKILKIQEEWIPLRTSYTMSDNTIEQSVEPEDPDAEDDTGGKNNE